MGVEMLTLIQKHEDNKHLKSVIAGSDELFLDTLESAALTQEKVEEAVTLSYKNLFHLQVIDFQGFMFTVSAKDYDNGSGYTCL